MRKTEPCMETGRDPVELLLRRIALTALHGSLIVGAGGCADEAGEPGDEPWTHGLGTQLQPNDYDPCATRMAGFPVRASELRLAQPADYVAVRQASGLGRDVVDPPAPADDGAWIRSTFSLVSEAGTACATATSEACAKQVAGHPENLYPSFCVQGCTEWSMVTTRGDEVRRWASPEQLTQELGPIDSHDEALLLVASHGYDVMCKGDESQSWTDPAAQLRYVRQVEGGYELFAGKFADLCPVVVRRHQLRVSVTGEVTELAARDFKGDNVCIGRVPAGLVPAPQAGSSLGEHLAACAHLEAASVFAFERLAHELRVHGAPTALIARVREAALDEVRHAQVVGALARAHGVEPLTPQVDEVATRSLEEIALENATEGCVRETYGAVVGSYQAERARDPSLRFAMRSIALDEARHAALSHEVHAWLMPQLALDTRDRIVRAQEAMIATLHGEDESSELRALAGLPSAEVAQGMLAALQRELWAPRALAG